MPYTDLIKQEGEYTYSANIQFDIENDTKLLRFIPNETTIKLMREYFTDLTRDKSFNHARILYGSYGTGKSHFLTVLSQLIEKQFTDSIAYRTFIDRIQEYDTSLAHDIEVYAKDNSRKPLLVVPIVFDFEDFDRCIYFSLKKKLDVLNIQVQYKTFYDQAELLINQWKNSKDSYERLLSVCEKEGIDLFTLESQLKRFDPKAEHDFEKVFSAMTFGVKYVYEVSSIEDTINQANKAISDEYNGIVFVFDEFGRYMEDNLKRIKVKAVQDIAEYCDHCDGNNHIILVSHKEISLYTQHYGKAIATEWKKVEGRYKADSINSKQDQCLSLVRSVLIKNEPAWSNFRRKYTAQLGKMYADAMDFKGFLLNSVNTDNPFESGFPLHPIALFALDKLSKKVAQNDRTFFTYLAGKDDNSLFRFLASHELNEFHFVGIDSIYDYFEPSIRAVQSDESYEWYKNLQSALAKNHSDDYEDSPEVRILKVIATIGIIGDASTLVANRHTIISTIDYPPEVLSNALDELSEKKIIKYSGTYDRYDFFDASIFDVEAMIEEESHHISEESVLSVLNENFVKFVLYPNDYNRRYKITRVFVPVFSTIDSVGKRSYVNNNGNTGDGVLVMLLGNPDISQDMVIEATKDLTRAVIWVNNDCASLLQMVKKYIAAKYLDTQKSKYVEKDPAFEKELHYNLREIVSIIDSMIDNWKQFRTEDNYVVCANRVHPGVSSIEEVSKLASEEMFAAFPQTLLVNNELINKNSISGSIGTAKKNAIRAIINGEDPSNYYGLQYLSPDYIAVRSVLAKNGFISVPDINEEDLNELPNGEKPQNSIKDYFHKIILRAQKGTVDFSEVYESLTDAPYGLRDGYLSLLFACVLIPYKKSLIISSHGSEQEITPELFDEIIRRPNDYVFTVANWSKDQLLFMDELEEVYKEYIDPSTLSKNRLKAIYDGMLSHYKAVPKFARTTQLYVSDSTVRYRQLMERSYVSYSTFFFAKLKGLAGSFEAAIEVVKGSKEELEKANKTLVDDLKKSICRTFGLPAGNSLCVAVNDKYNHDWSQKRRKSFDYYTNAFLEYVSEITITSTEEGIINRLAKILTGIELTYWGDKHITDFEERLEGISSKLDSYIVSDELKESETKITVTSSSGLEKELIFDNGVLSDLNITVKNKINSTLNNFGLSVQYDDKVRILLSLLTDLIEGK